MMGMPYIELCKSWDQCLKNFDSIDGVEPLPWSWAAPQELYSINGVERWTPLWMLNVWISYWSIEWGALFILCYWPWYASILCMTIEWRLFYFIEWMQKSSKTMHWRRLYESTFHILIIMLESLCWIQYIYVCLLKMVIPFLRTTCFYSITLSWITWLESINLSYIVHWKVNFIYKLEWLLNLRPNSRNLLL